MMIKATLKKLKRGDILKINWVGAGDLIQFTLHLLPIVLPIIKKDLQPNQHKPSFV